MLASVRPYHHPIRRNDMIPTPSQPIKSWNILFAVTRIIMAMRKISRYLKKRFMLGSVCMYQEANSRMDHVTNRAIGVKIVEKKSNLRLMQRLKVSVPIHFQSVIIVSVP